MVGGEGFEPSKAQGQQIYSLSRLTASVSTQEWWPQPTEYARVWQEMVYFGYVISCAEKGLVPGSLPLDVDRGEYHSDFVCSDAKMGFRYGIMGVLGAERGYRCGRDSADSDRGNQDGVWIWSTGLYDSILGKYGIRGGVYSALRRVPPCVFLVHT